MLGSLIYNKWSWANWFHCHCCRYGQAVTVSSCINLSDRMEFSVTTTSERVVPAYHIQIQPAVLIFPVVPYNAESKQLWYTSFIMWINYIWTRYNLMLIVAITFLSSIAQYTQSTVSITKWEFHFLPRNALQCKCAVLGSHVVRLSVCPSVRLWRWWIVIT